MGLHDRLEEVGDEPWKVLLYGYPGCGKTILAGRAPNALLLDSERGAVSFNKHDDVNVKRIPVKTCREVEMIAADFAVGRDPLVKEIDTIIVDTMTSLRIYELQQLVKTMESDSEVPSQYEYNIANTRMTNMMLRLFRSGKNVILVTHIREEIDKEGTITMIRPGLPPANRGAVMAFVDAAFYLEADYDAGGKVERTLFCSPTRKRQGKVRFQLPSRIKGDEINSLWLRLDNGV